MQTFLFYENPVIITPCYIISGKDAVDAYKNLKAIRKVNRGIMVPADVVNNMGSYDEGSYFNPPV